MEEDEETRKPASFITTQKKKRMLVDEFGYEYLRKDGNSGNEYWRCRHFKTKSCPAKATTTTDKEGLVWIKNIKVSDIRY